MVKFGQNERFRTVRNKFGKAGFDVIKLQDFARDQGVTDRAIQKHLKKYEAELAGLFERKGPNGTWLTEEACEFLRGKMVTPPPPVIYSEDPRVERLEGRVAELEAKLEKKEAMLTVAQEQVQEAQRNVNALQAKVDERRALEAANRSLERDVEDLKREIESKDAEIRAATEKAEQERQAAAEHVADVEGKLQTAEQTARAETERADQAEQARTAAEDKLAQIRAKTAELEHAGIFRRRKILRELMELEAGKE